MNFKLIKNAKISIKLTILYAFMFSFLLLILNAAILYGIRYYLYSQADAQIKSVQVAVTNKITSQEEASKLSDKDVVSEVPSMENIFIRIVDSKGNIINTSEGFNYKIKTQEAEDKIKHQEEDGIHLEYMNISLENPEYGKVYLQIVKDMYKEYKFLKILFIFMAMADFIGILVSIILGFIISKKILKPIDYITKTAENISINNLKERIEVKGPEDELKRLGDTFNKMTDRLQEAFERQTQFVSDASHELRTPIAVIAGYANLLDRWGKDDREALEKSIYAIKLETSNMTELVEKLLFLAKGDSGTQKLAKEEFSLNELVEEVVAESKLLTNKHNISCNSNEKISILADYKMIKQMFRVFIDNSIKFTPENGEIDISTRKQQNSIIITISDSGIGIPKEELKHIFDRFYTVDKSRSKDMGGTGLGLSIASWIVKKHQGCITVESEEGKGTRIIVKFEL